MELTGRALQMNRERVVIGVLNLSLRAAYVVLKHCRDRHAVTVVCRTRTRSASFLLRARLRNRLTLQVLDRDPYYLSAQHISDGQGRSYRCDAIESVISASRSAVEEANGDMETVLLALGLGGSSDIVRRFLRHQIGESLKNHVYLGYHLMTLNGHADGSQNALLLLPRKWWAGSIRQAFVGTGLRIAEHSTAASVGENGVALLRHFLKANRRTGNALGAETSRHSDMDRGDLECDDPCSRTGSWHGPRVSGVVFDGLDVSQRNNVGWAWCSGLSLDGFVFLWSVVSRRPTAWEAALAQYGAHIVDVSPNGVSTQFAEDRMRRPRRAARIWHRMLVYLTVATRYPARFFVRRYQWVLTNVVLLLSRERDWVSIFERQNVRVHVEFDYGVDACARALAIRGLDGVVILDQRSQYYDNYDHTSDRPGDLAFISGPSGLRYYAPSRFEVPKVVMTGLSMDGGGAVSPRLAAGDTAYPVRVAVFDEPGVLYGAEHVWTFIATMIDHCHAHGGYQLVFKPKRWRNLVMHLPPHIVVMLDTLLATGKCVVLPAEQSVHAVCRASDLVVSVPSTAACIAVGTGTPTLVYNPYHTIRTMFYEHGLDGKCIFDRLDGLRSAVSVFLDHGHDQIGKCDALRQALDPWLDMGGNRRKGYFIDKLIGEFAAGRKRNEAIGAAVNAYRQRFGNHTAGTWQEAWTGYGGEQSGLMSEPPRYDRAVAIERAA